MREHGSNISNVMKNASLVFQVFYLSNLNSQQPYERSILQTENEGAKSLNNCKVPHAGTVEPRI